MSEVYYVIDHDGQSSIVRQKDLVCHDDQYPLVVINLTKVFGEGREPSHDACDVLLNDYIDNLI